MELSTPENEAIVRSICEAVSADRESGKPVKPDHHLIYDIDVLLMEASSGASFEQYFRWASVEEIGRVVPTLRTGGPARCCGTDRESHPGGFPEGYSEARQGAPAEGPRLASQYSFELKRTAVRALSQAFLLLASCALASAAHASYGQMRLDGAGLFLAFALTVGYALIVDVALIAGLFRYRAGLVGGVVVSLVVILLVLGLTASPSERTGFFKGGPGGAPLVMLLVTSAVLLPFIVIAPFAQHRAMRQGRRFRGWIIAWMGLQLALLPGFLVLAWTEERFWKQEYGAGLNVGRAAEAGGLGVILERAEQRRERIWGTGWTSPWQQKPSGGYPARRSGWMSGLARGMDDSAPIAANEPLSESDRTVLRTLIERHLAGYAIPNIRTKLLWDALKPGSFSRQLAPAGVNEVGAVDEEVLALLLERLERYGDARVCPGGRMMDADRALLSQLVLAKVRFFDEARKRELAAELDAKKDDREMSEAPLPYRLLWKAANAVGNAVAQPVRVPDWGGYPERLERACRGPE